MKSREKPSKITIGFFFPVLKKRLLPQPNNLPGPYEEACNFVKPFLLPFETYHVCPNDCVLFCETTRYDYSKLVSYPVCGTKRYSANRKARRTFMYYPLLCTPRRGNLWGCSLELLAHNRAKNRSQASNVMKATGSRGVNCFMLLPNHDRPNQAFPDMMHDVKNIVCAFFELFIWKGDSVKVRNAERDLGRFKSSWFVKHKQDDIPEKEQLTNGNFFQIILLFKRFYNNLYRRHIISNAIWDL